MTGASLSGPRVRRASLIARHTLPAALEALREAAAHLERRGCAPVIESTTAEAAGIGGRWPAVSRDTLAAGVDVVIAFGGDGTLLDAASAVSHSAHDAPLVGINLGHLGFLTEVGRQDMIAALDRLVDGETTVEERLLLAGRVHRQGGALPDRFALNDIVVTRGALARMIEIDVEVDGAPVSHVKADGLIVATATGSTAYNLSAGGPILHPSADAVVLTPLAPHALTNRPVVLPASSNIRLRPMVDPSSDPVLTFDGQHGVPLQTGDEVDIMRAPRVLRLLRTSGRTHFDMLREKLKWT
ncbi:MAG TPA: NAD(+)/NADH kinase [Vicinamibacterales bacterium]|nr:NAD(+)/NADH kinase [Vicinamibacterales bacterium]